MIDMPEIEYDQSRKKIVLSWCQCMLTRKAPRSSNYYHVNLVGELELTAARTADTPLYVRLVYDRPKNSHLFHPVRNTPITLNSFTQ